VTGIDTPTIPMNYTRLLARGIGLKQKGIQQLLTGTGISTAAFNAADQHLTGSQQIQIVRNAMGMTQNPAFGLHLGKLLVPSSYGALGFLVLSSANLMQAYYALSEFLPTQISFAKLRIEERDNEFVISIGFSVELEPALLKCLFETGAKTLFNCAESILGRPVSSPTVYFSYPQPNYIEEYRKSFPGELKFNQPANQIIIPMTEALCSNVGSNPDNYIIALEQCKKMKDNLAIDNTTIKYRVQQLMLNAPPGTLSEEQAANALFIDKRTLARKLAKENTHFRQLRDDILSQQAASYLQETQMSVDAIATLLNYHDSSNFRRAFKRWFGLTPMAFRNKMASRKE